MNDLPSKLVAAGARIRWRYRLHWLGQYALALADHLGRYGRLLFISDGMLTLIGCTSRSGFGFCCGRHSGHCGSRPRVSRSKVF